MAGSRHLVWVGPRLPRRSANDPKRTPALGPPPAVLQSINSSAYGPGPGGESDTPIRLSWQSCVEHPSEERSAIGLERGNVRWSRTSPSKEGAPVVVKACEYRGYLDRVTVHITQTTVAEQCRQRVTPTKRESSTFVQLSGRGVQLCRRIPEVPQELHSVSVVPHAGRNSGAW